MSHVSSVSCKIRDLDALEKACKDLGLVFKLDQKTFKWFGSWVNDFDEERAAYLNGVSTENYGTCEHAIQLPGTEYEIGLMHNKDGDLVPVFDEFGSGHNLMNVLGGKGLPKLVQAYAVKAAENALEAHLGPMGYTKVAVLGEIGKKVTVQFRRDL